MSLPCPADDLTWVQGALDQHSDRITARDLAESVSSRKSATDTKAKPLVLDRKGFLGS